MRRVALCAAAAGIVSLWLSGTAGAYGWPLRPFDKMHPIRAAFDDPRFHLGTNESALSAFHFGVDIVAKDGTRVYSVAPGFVRKYRDHVTVRRPATGRAYGYWHIIPAVHTGQHVRMHQFLGTIEKGWGHVHFAESLDGAYRNPLRKGALTPFRDHTNPIVASISFVGANGQSLSPGDVRGVVDVEASIYDTPPIAPPGAWSVARLTPALVMWELVRNGAPLINWTLSADFTYSLMPGPAYPYIYAPGTYQNKAHRPGNYIFWVTHGLDTTALPNGSYTINVLAEDTRWNEGELSLGVTIANDGPLTPTYAFRWAGGYAQ